MKMYNKIYMLVSYISMLFYKCITIILRDFEKNTIFTHPFYSNCWFHANSKQMFL